ncbi:MAG: hypothetical protein HQL65_07560 [Magnetococcales bacterium]|nr:hypothetical protein [Magnetococcales bacterium]
MKKTISKISSVFAGLLGASVLLGGAAGQAAEPQWLSKAIDINNTQAINSLLNVDCRPSDISGVDGAVVRYTSGSITVYLLCRVDNSGDHRWTFLSTAEDGGNTTRILENLVKSGNVRLLGGAGFHGGRPNEIYYLQRQ